MQEKTKVANLTRPNCPFCHQDVLPGEDEKVVCSGCLAIHHKSCVEEGDKSCSSCRKPLPVSQETATTTNSATGLLLKSFEFNVRGYAIIDENSSVEKIERLIAHYTNEVEQRVRYGDWNLALVALNKASMLDQNATNLGLKRNPNAELIELTDRIIRTYIQSSPRGARFSNVSFLSKLVWAFLSLLAASTIGFLLTDNKSDGIATLFVIAGIVNLFLLTIAFVARMDPPTRFKRFKVADFSPVNFTTSLQKQEDFYYFDNVPLVQFQSLEDLKRRHDA